MRSIKTAISAGLLPWRSLLREKVKLNLKSHQFCLQRRLTLTKQVTLGQNRSAIEMSVARVEANKAIT